jgi:hypothetical protein
MEISLNAGIGLYAKGVASAWNEAMQSTQTGTKDKTALSTAEKTSVQSATTTMVDVAAQLYTAGKTDSGTSMSQKDMSDILTSAYPSLANTVINTTQSANQISATTAMRNLVAKMYDTTSSDSDLADIVKSAYSVEA